MREKRRWLLFEASADGSLSRGDMIHAFNVLSGKLGLKGDDRPWLTIFEPCPDTPGKYYGIFRVPRDVQRRIMDALRDGNEINGVAVRSIKTSGSIRRTKGSLAALLKRC